MPSYNDTKFITQFPRECGFLTGSMDPLVGEGDKYNFFILRLKICRGQYFAI